MINFVTIDPAKTAVLVVQAEELPEVLPSVGLNGGEVDFGCIYREPSNGETINIVVYEYGMFRGAEGRYFSIGENLYEGGAVLFAADHQGETVSLKHAPPVMFYRDHEEVERAIAAGDLVRPEMRVNGELTWAWPSTRRPF